MLFRNPVARIPLYLCTGMKQKEHLPIFGIGPVYIGTIASLAAIGIFLARKK